MENKLAASPRKVKGKIFIDKDRCKGCGLCLSACREALLVLSESINQKGYHYATAMPDGCTGCINCAIVCPDAAITVYRTRPGRSNY